MNDSKYELHYKGGNISFKLGRRFYQLGVKYFSDGSTSAYIGNAGVVDGYEILPINITKEFAGESLMFAFISAWFEIEEYVHGCVTKFHARWNKGEGFTEYPEWQLSSDQPIWSSGFFKQSFSDRCYQPSLFEA